MLGKAAWEQFAAEEQADQKFFELRLYLLFPKPAVILSSSFS